jgi:hypothetical protein
MSDAPADAPAEMDDTEQVGDVAFDSQLNGQ